MRTQSACLLALYDHCCCVFPRYNVYEYNLNYCLAYVLLSSPCSLSIVLCCFPSPPTDLTVYVHHILLFKIPSIC